METIQKFPEYLFGKIALIEYYLNRNEHFKVPEMLDGKYELAQHCPKVEIFHVSEVRTFFCLMGVYFARVNDIARALYYYCVLTDIDPDHIATQKLGKEIILKEIENMRQTYQKKKRRKRIAK